MCVLYRVGTQSAGNWYRNIAHETYSFAEKNNRCIFLYMTDDDSESILELTEVPFIYCSYNFVNFSCINESVSCYHPAKTLANYEHQLIASLHYYLTHDTVAFAPLETGEINTDQHLNQVKSNVPKNMITAILYLWSNFINAS